MKVVLISSSSGSRGGGELYLKSLAIGLRSVGHAVVTLMSTASHMDELAGQFADQDLDVRRIIYRNTYQRKLRTVGSVLDWRQQGEVSQLVRSLRADVIHVNQQCVEDGLDLLCGVRKSGVPAVSTIHVTRSMAGLGAVGGRLRDWIARRTLKKVQIPLLAISPTSAGDLSSFLNGWQGRSNVIRPESLSVDGPGAVDSSDLSSLPIYVVSNGVASPLRGDRDVIRAEWGIPADAVVLGCLARIEQQKNPLFLVQLLKVLPSQVHVVWVGDGRLRPELERAIQGAGLSDRFHLDGWRSDASSRLTSFDVFVLPSHYEGLPLALLEAMACRLPVVASNVDGIQDAVSPEAGGVLCPVDDLKSWSAAILPLVESFSKRQEAGGLAYRHYCEQFSLDRMASDTAAVYDDVLRRFRRHGPANVCPAAFNH